MKVITRIFVAIISLGAIGFLAIAMFAPEKGKELEEKLEDLVNQRAERMEVTPVRELSIEYELPLDNDEVMFEEYGFEYGFDVNYPDRVYTWFRDLGRDLWLPFYHDDRAAEVGDVILLNRDGVLKHLKKGEYAGNSFSGEAVLYAEALEELPEGDYWAALLIRYQDRPEESYYLFRYIGIYEECTFHTEDYDIATGDGGDLLIDRSTGEDFTFHLANLGDNVVTDVWKLENMAGEYTRKHLKEGEEYIVSEDGASVTLTNEYLNSLQDLYGYWFLFGLGDHSEVSPFEAGSGKYLTLFFTDGPIADPPYIDGPSRYSLSSGEDYVFTLHLGRAIRILEDNSILTISDEDGMEIRDEEGRAIKVFSLHNDDIRADETYVIPASVFQEAAGQGAKNCWLGIPFQVTEFAASSYIPYKGMNIELIP